MLSPDLDRYYTPARLARQMVEICEPAVTGRCLDTACGDGSLLAAARSAYSNVQCIGIDVDAVTIARLRRKHPTWILSRADALSDAAWRRASAARLSVDCELALLNPPFSMAAKKGVVIEVGDFAGRCSVAMAHLLTVLIRARPKTCCAIVPESLLFSQLDDRARRFLAPEYSLTSVRSLRNSTFRGGRANATVVKVVRYVAPIPSHVGPDDESELVELSIVRGGLPLFQSILDRAGLPYVHSTDLCTIASGRMSIRRVRPLLRGVVSGDVILLPRVGIPLWNSVRALRFQSRVQLSDCVIALCFQSHAAAIRWEAALFQSWDDLVALYRGTGARYVTVSRLRSWLASLHSRPTGGLGEFRNFQGADS
jgi:hypothetical protein